MNSFLLFIDISHIINKLLCPKAILSVMAFHSDCSAHKDIALVLELQRRKRIASVRVRCTETAYAEVGLPGF